MADATTTQKTGDSHDEETRDDALDDLLREVAHAPPRRPPPGPALPGERWGAGGRYVIDKRLGRGGMGTVYAAEDTLLHRTVALKVLDAGAGDDDDHRARLLREARLAARIEHERVARVYDVGEHEGALFVAMELVRGVTLRTWMTGRTLAAGEILTVGRQIAEGLAVLHAAGVFHRDLKPENVMLAEPGGVRLLDFGLARRTSTAAHASAEARDLGGEPGESQSLPGFSGTPAYMAPEQWSGHRLDARVDVFALGVILYELVTGARPFDRAKDTDPSAPWTPPNFASAAWDRVPPDLKAATERMLARDAEARLADGAAARDALGAMATEPVASSALLPPPAAAELAHVSTEAAAVVRQPRRRWLVVGAAVVLGAAALVVVRAVPLLRRPAPRRPPLPGMVWIDVGTITVGRSPEDLDQECAAIGAGCRRDLMQREVPAVRVEVPPFQIDVNEVTNEEMADMLQERTGSLYVAEDEDDHYPRYVRWNNGLGHDGELLADLHPLGGGIEYRSDRTFHARAGRERWPAVQVTWYAARLFCTTRGKFLPTEDEWEAAARGRENRPYPWGRDEVRCGEVVVPRDGLIRMPADCPQRVSVRPVGQAAQDVTPEGAHDLGGNVAEWVSAVFVPGDRGARVDAGAADRPKVVRGGSFAESHMARTSGRRGLVADRVGDNVGFRCAVR